MVEGLESAQEVLAQAPDLAVVQQDGEYQGYIDPALDLEAEGTGATQWGRDGGSGSVHLRHHNYLKGGKSAVCLFQLQ